MSLLKEFLMKKTLWALSAVIMLVGFTGCDADEGDECAADADCVSKDKTMICQAKQCVVPDCGNKLYCAGADKCVRAANAKDGKDHCVSATIAKCVNESQGRKWLNEKMLCEDAQITSCNTDTDCSKDMHCDTTSHRCADGAPSGNEFKYVRIDDLSQKDTSGKKLEDPGADIDAIVLTKKSGGSPVYATTVKGYHRADGVSASADKSVAANPQMALGQPDSFIGYPSNTTDCYYYAKDKQAGDKTVDRPFVSLGGLGGYLIVEMGNKIEAGDNLAVLELGACKLQNTKDGKDHKGIPEGVRVQVSVSGEDGSWKAVGDSSSQAKETGKFNGIFTVNISDGMLK